MDYLLISLFIASFLFDTILSILNYKNKDNEVPDEVKDVYDEEAYNNWLKYNMETFRLSMITKCINFVIMFSLLVFRIFPRIYNFAREVSNDKVIQTLIFFGIYFLIDYIIGIFASYYSQFSIEERYGFNKTTKKTFVIDKIKTLILIIGLGGGILYLLTFAYYSVEPFVFYLYALIGSILFILIINLLYSKVFVRIFNKLTPLEDGELKEKIVELAKEVGYEVNKISVMDASKRTTKLNASFSGFGRFKQVILFDNLLNKMTSDQIVSVLAHEIGHAKKNHIIKNLLMTIIKLSIYFTIILFTSTYDNLSMLFGFESANIAFGIILFFIIMEPISIIDRIIFNYISRRFEYQADHYAATNYNKESMIEALKILCRENFANLTPHPLYVKFNYSHPPVAYRIAAINNIK